MNALAVVVNALLVGLQVFLYASYPSPIILAMLVITVLMFIWTLVSAAQS